MSNLKVQASPTGTGVVTLVPPTTNTDRTVTLPDQTGTVYITGGDIGTPSAGNGSNLTNLNASNLSTGTVPDARFPATLPAASGANLTALNASNLSSGTVPDARFPATLPAASGANLTNLNASNLSSGTVATARLGTGTANSTTFLRGDQTWATAGGAPSGIDAVGSVLWAAVNTTSTILPGNTIAGSSLYYITAVSNGSSGNSTTTTSWATSTSFVGRAFRATTGNTGYQVPLGASTLSGTWRLLTPGVIREASYQACGNETFSLTYCAFVVRTA